MLMFRGESIWEKADRELEEARRTLDPDVKIWYDFLAATRKYLNEPYTQKAA